MTYSLWWFSRAYAGEVRLLVTPADPETEMLTGSDKITFLLLSVLDFWGNRHDRSKFNSNLSLRQ